jgi:VIT1/CCC1 family predicted Fe2+/Mn2+ transporter
MLLDWIFQHRETGNHLSRAQEYLKQIVYGGNDGIVTTFAIVAGFAGASVDGAGEIGTIAVIVFGLANLLADALSMGLGEFLSGRSHRDMHSAARTRLLHELRDDPARARAAVEALLTDGGLDPDGARDAADILIRNPGFVADLIMAYEYKMTDPRSLRPALDGLVTFLSFVALGLLPLLPYLLAAPDDLAFRLSVATTALALLALGLLRWQATGERPLRSIGETMLVGGTCAVVAYAVGLMVAGG